MSDDLEKQAQAKLSEARRLISEAGELAKQGQFSLHFGEIGDFIPRTAVDPDMLRERAIAELQGETFEGLTGHLGTVGWVDLTEDEREEQIENKIEELQDAFDVPYEFREYYRVSDADDWWAPSRC